MIVYAVLMEVSIGKMYMAGVIPGLLLTGMFMLTIYVAAKLWPAVAPREPGAPWLQRFIALAAMVPFVVLVLIVLGTIYLGWATATESAAFGAVGAFLIAAANGRVNWKMLKEAMLNTATTTAMIMFIVTAALVLNFVMVHLDIPAALAQTVGSLGLSPLAIILALMVLYLVLGTFMDGLAMVLTTLPVLLPVLKALNIDLIWFGILLVIITEAALISPPEGMNLYVLQALRKRGPGAASKETIMDVYVGVMPFLAAIILTLALVIAFPQIAMWLPSMMQIR
jgi:tripartite ATP-independent transporter DctM subunit